MRSRSKIKKIFKAFFALVILTGFISGCATKGDMMFNKTETESQQDPVRR